MFNSKLNFISYLPLIGSFIYAFQRLLPLTQLIYAASANYKYKSFVIKEVVNDLEEGKNNEALYLSRKKIYFKKDISFKNISLEYSKENNILDNLNFNI